jgi:hypothetical protein
MISSSSVFTRPADVVAYSANDCVSNSTSAPQLFANSAILIDSIDLPAMKTDGTGSDCSYAINRDLLSSYTGCLAGKIYGLLETLDVFTPASGQQFQVEITTATDYNAFPQLS